MTTFFDDAPQPVKPAHHAVAEELTFDLKDELKEERPKHPVTKHFFETY
jgi:hypothetical protein